MVITNEINNRIRQFILTNYPLARKQPIVDGDSLFSSGIVDSLGVLDLVMFVEEEFKITVSDEDLLPENFETIAQLAAFVETKHNGKLTI